MKRAKKRKSTKKRIAKPKRHAIPAWFMAIKPGSHGTTPAQKRLWRIVSDTYRLEDWKNDPHCRTCGVYLHSWTDGQCGHYKSWAACHSWFKFERKNLALQCATCNANFQKTNVIGFVFGTYLQSKYGMSVVDWIETENEMYKGQKMKDSECVEYAAKLRPDLVHSR